MALNLDQQPESHGVPQPLFERIQEFVFRMDMGAGVKWFRVVLFVLLVLLVVLIYTGTQFFGLRDREAMELGQLGRNLAVGRGYVTQVIRPYVMAYLVSVGKPPLLTTGDRPARETDPCWQPELWTPPGYPLFLSIVFQIYEPDFSVKPGSGSLEADRELMVVSWLLFLSGLLLVYLMARDMFDHRVAVLSVFLYLFCDPLLEFAVSGGPMMFLSLLFLIACQGLLKAERWQMGGKPAWWTYSAVAVSALAVALGVLTDYAMVSVLVPLVVYLLVSFPRQRWQMMGLCLAVFMVVVGPWMARNWLVSRTLFGLTRLELFEGTGWGTENEVKPGQMQRQLEPDQRRMRPRAVIRKAVLNMQTVYRQTFKDVGANFVIAFFLVALLHRFRVEEVFRLRRLVFWSMVMCTGWLAVAGTPERNKLTMFLPLVIIYGSAFFYVTFERLQFRTLLMRKGMVGLFAGLNMLPFVLTILPPSTTIPYPPYDGGIVAGLRVAFRPEETLVSDIPWAVAWYADRTAIWQPYDQQDFITINDRLRFVSGIYLTQATLQNLTVVEMLTGRQRFWIQMFQPPPPDFPLQFYRPLTPDGQQVLIGNRAR